LSTKAIRSTAFHCRVFSAKSDTSALVKVSVYLQNQAFLSLSETVRPIPRHPCPTNEPCVDAIIIESYNNV
jgi:hypothetical protein